MIGNMEKGNWGEKIDEDDEQCWPHDRFRAGVSHIKPDVAVEQRGPLILPPNA